MIRKNSMMCFALMSIMNIGVILCDVNVESASSEVELECDVLYRLGESLGASKDAVVYACSKLREIDVLRPYSTVNAWDNVLSVDEHRLHDAYGLFNCMLASEDVVALSNEITVQDTGDEPAYRKDSLEEAHELYNGVINAFQNQEFKTCVSSLQALDDLIQKEGLSEEIYLLSSYWRLKSYVAMHCFDEAAQETLSIMKFIAVLSSSLKDSNRRLIVNEMNRMLAIEALKISVMLNNGEKIRSIDITGFPKFSYGFDLAERICSILIEYPSADIRDRAYINRGISKLRMGKFQEAKDDFDRILGGIYFATTDVIRAVILAQAELCCCMQAAAPYNEQSLKLADQLFQYVRYAHSIGASLTDNLDLFLGVVHARQYVRETYAYNRLYDARQLLKYEGKAAEMGVRLYCERIVKHFSDTRAAKFAVEILAKYC